eukprot:c20316_g1_i4.p1 GENE.c20316_g1_i4~~c20316_g1_i4.p1  ORF type:complete len:317 (+),score=42.42 c20316_g1_i4:55-951(+)
MEEAGTEREVKHDLPILVLSALVAVFRSAFDAFVFVRLRDTFPIEESAVHDGTLGWRGMSYACALYALLIDLLLFFTWSIAVCDYCGRSYAASKSLVYLTSRQGMIPTIVVGALQIGPCVHLCTQPFNFYTAGALFLILIDLGRAFLAQTQPGILVAAIKLTVNQIASVVVLGLAIVDFANGREYVGVSAVWVFVCLTASTLFECYKAVNRILTAPELLQNWPILVCLMVTIVCVIPYLIFLYSSVVHHYHDSDHSLKQISHAVVISFFVGLGVFFLMCCGVCCVLGVRGSQRQMGDV